MFYLTTHKALNQNPKAKVESTFLAFLSATAATDFLAGEADLGVVAVGHSLVSMSLSASNFFFPDFCHIVRDSMVTLIFLLEFEDLKNIQSDP